MFEDKLHPFEMYDDVKLYTLCILIDLKSDDVYISTGKGST